MVHEHVSAVVAHAANMAAMVAMMHGKTKVDVSHLPDVKTHIDSKCKIKSKHGGSEMAGGLSMPSDFFGYPHPAYSAAHANQGVQVSTISWGSQEARPAQGPAQSQTGGGKVAHKHHRADASIKAALKGHGLAISKAALDGLNDIIDAHLHCFARDLQKAAPVTVKKLEKILNLRRHAAFH